MLIEGGLDLTICPLRCLGASLPRLKEVLGEIVVEHWLGIVHAGSLLNGDRVGSLAVVAAALAWRSCSEGCLVGWLHDCWALEVEEEACRD
jgi:hypothetical protein